ncbi:MAG: pyridoxal-phosphate-dependent aminotransferase family protein [Terriglobales bacterium]
MRKERLFTPGPTALLPAAQAAMAAMGLHHRTAEFRQIFSATRSLLQEFLGTQNDVLMLASSGSGAMEAALVNAISAGDPVVVLSAGKFGERWEELAKAFGARLEGVRKPYGQSFDAGDIEGKVTKDTVALAFQATESSTGIRHDVEGLARAARRANPNILVLVDAITGIGTSPIEIDAWDLDYVIGGSQKAVMMQPGLAYLSVSPRAWGAMAANQTRRYYFDLRRERKSQAQGESACTPATGLIAALQAALQFIAAQGGRAALVANAEMLAAATRAAAEALGLKRFGTGQPAGALTAIQSPPGLDSGEIVKAMRRDFGSVIANGQGEMKGQLFRVAHLGYYDAADTFSLIAQLELVLAQAGRLERGRLGQGVRAAQEVWLQHRPVPAAAPMMAGQER